jgi:outer membrane protein OmpA-like peptidoglycan-associated protein
MNAKTFSRMMGVALGPMLLLSTGCIATRKYVKNTTTPLDSRITKVDQKVDQKTAQNAQDIRNLDDKTEAGISDARNSAEKANQAAGQADQHAQQARQVADQGVAEANKAQEMVNNFDNYQADQRATILFSLNKATLTKEDMERLDQLAQTVGSMKHYVIQIQGYTDQTGPKEYNLQLSQKRANAVIRYLTTNGKIPLVRIYSMGYGESDPAAPNSSRKGRELNRRVDLTVMVPQMPVSAQQPAHENQASANMNP